MAQVDLHKALFKFQGIINKVGKGQKAHNYKYANLADVWDEVQPKLQECGLLALQSVETLEDQTFIVTKIMHVESGGYIESKVRIDEYVTPGKGDMKQLGCAISYGRRYALGAMLGVVTDDDIEKDNERSYVRQNKQEEAKQPQKQNTITEYQAQQIMDKLRERPDVLKEVLERAKLKSINDIPQGFYENVVRFINSRLEKTA